MFFFFKHKTAYEMRISDWSSDVCSSDLLHGGCPSGRSREPARVASPQPWTGFRRFRCAGRDLRHLSAEYRGRYLGGHAIPGSHHDLSQGGRRGLPPERHFVQCAPAMPAPGAARREGVSEPTAFDVDERSEEHTSELQSIMRHSY